MPFSITVVAAPLLQHFDESLILPCFLPFHSWICSDYRVFEDEILKTSGLDALIIIRLFFFFCLNHQALQDGLAILFLVVDLVGGQRWREEGEFGCEGRAHAPDSQNLE
ncbi:hypothetical protein RchiOBHm_Chr2g0134811 [Rosa chinensis]|uniref:Uncharacterized protein n=1 Tax=Rosa chinensis TaxID=74649 RepID=A0A2P6RVX5_ROSCH|nr:hypothetical protein RchiOBHm_Chr2g0134811 [Rosa chinensis]